MAVDNYYDENIVSMIDSWSKPLPTMMLCGKTGSGKKNICDYISSKFNLEYVDITDSLTLDTIESINMSVFPKLYTIDTSKISIKEQNTILKFLEEPLANAYIVLLCSNINYVLDTVKNRCIIYYIKQYSQEELAKYSNSDADIAIKLKLAETPGQMISLNSINVSELYDFAYKVIDKINVANVVNALISIPAKIAFKNEQNKFDFELFCKALLVTCKEKMISDKDFNINYYKLTNKLYNDINIPNIKREMLFENYILELKGV